MLLDNDAVTLAEFLYEGTCAEKKRPTLKEVDAYIDQVDDIDALYEEVIDELKKHNATRQDGTDAETDGCGEQEITSSLETYDNIV